MGCFDLNKNNCRNIDDHKKKMNRGNKKEDCHKSGNIGEQDT